MKDKIDVTKIMDLVDARTKLKQESVDINKRIQGLTEIIERTCLHSVIKKDRHYCAGGYDDVSSVTITETCVICGKVVKSYDDPNHRGTHG